MSHTKTVFNTGEIPHLWVTQKVKQARNRQGNLYFEGKTIFSYGSHFPIARLVSRNGKTAVLFTQRTYSNMTASHCHQVRLACRQFPIFNVPYVGATSREVLAGYRDRINNLLTVARKARYGRSMNNSLAEADRLILHFNDYAKFFGLTFRLARPEDWSKLWARSVVLVDEYKVKEAEREEIRKAAQAEREAKLQAAFEANLPEWEAGRITTQRLGYRSSTVYLRLVGKYRVETSLGVILPLKAAEMVWNLVLRARKSLGALNLVDNPPIIPGLDYWIERIDSDGMIHAGCHRIKWEQIKRFADRMGWKYDEV